MRRTQTARWVALLVVSLLASSAWGAEKYKRPANAVRAADPTVLRARTIPGTRTVTAARRGLGPRLFTVSPQGHVLQNATWLGSEAWNLVVELRNPAARPANDEAGADGIRWGDGTGRGLPTISNTGRSIRFHVASKDGRTRNFLLHVGGSEMSLSLDPASRPDPTRAEVARRAYEIWEQGGRRQGTAQANWLQAEAELRGLAKPQPTHQQIATRAYQIWEASGRATGNDRANWAQAELELKK